MQLQLSALTNSKRVATCTLSDIIAAENILCFMNFCKGASMEVRDAVILAMTGALDIGMMHASETAFSAWLILTASLISSEQFTH
ncbi:unnamed protein product [Ceratitis capitata]|uniref:(Mediterranean fruit fly) hypothetical protein n=1 Tax=Ceratitis capitata TaxID=7213 RepID=A0A811US43_CERCA|nr:unnamed protein product [Ceratitis capitata]